MNRKSSIEVATKIVKRLSDRSGMDFDFDDETMTEIYSDIADCIDEAISKEKLIQSYQGGN